MNTQAQQPETNEVKDLVVLLDLSQTEKDLMEVEQQLANVVHDVKTKTGMKAAKADVSKLRGMRTTVDKVRLEAGRVLLSLKKTNDDKAKALIDRISALEQPLKDQIDAYEAEQEAIRLAAIKAEQDRVDGHRARIAAWRNLPGEIAGRPLAGMRLALKRLTEETPPDFAVFEEFQQEAADAHMAVCARVTEMVDQAQASEDAAERARQQEAELQAMRERNAALEREAEERRQADARREQAAREEADLKEREAQRAEEMRVHNIRQQIATIRYSTENLRGMRSAELQAHLAQIHELNPEASSFDFQEFHAEAVKAFGEAVSSMGIAIIVQQHEEDRAAEAEQQRQSELAESRRLQQEADARAAEAERAHRDAAAKAEEDRKSSLTLRAAAQALVDHCVSRGMGHDKPVEDLNAVLLNSEGDVPQVRGKRQAKAPTKVAR